MPNFDLRTFTIENRNYFWRAAEMALNRKIAMAIDEHHEIEMLLAKLLDMHERTLKGEDPMLLNDLDDIIPEPSEKLGPGWYNSSPSPFFPIFPQWNSDASPPKHSQT